MCFKHAPAYSYSYSYIHLLLFIHFILNSSRFPFIFPQHHAWTINFIFCIYTQNVLKSRALVAHMVGCETDNLKVVGSIPLPTENVRILLFWRELVDQSANGDTQLAKKNKHTNTQLANNVAYTKNLLQGSCVF
jgi:hypothetical protein